MGDVLPAIFAALGAVIGLILGAILGGVVGLAVSRSDLSDLISATVGGLAGAVALAWLGLRLAGRFRQSKRQTSYRRERAGVSVKMALWAVVIALAVYGIVLYARGDFA